MLDPAPCGSGRQLEVRPSNGVPGPVDQVAEAGQRQRGGPDVAAHAFLARHHGPPDARDLPLNRDEVCRPRTRPRRSARTCRPPPRSRLRRRSRSRSLRDMSPARVSSTAPTVHSATAVISVGRDVGRHGGKGDSGAAGPQRGSALSRPPPTWVRALRNCSTNHRRPGPCRLPTSRRHGPRGAGGKPAAISITRSSAAGQFRTGSLAASPDARVSLATHRAEFKGPNGFHRCQESLEKASVGSEVTRHTGCCISLSSVTVRSVAWR